jgi:periplasmic divalent cation tolerance protein
MKEYLLFLITTPQGEPATEIANTLVKDGLAACVNIVRGVESVYAWKGKIEQEKEDLLIVKTRAEHLHHLTQKVIDIHPHEVPEVVAFSLEAGSSAYLQWIDEVVKHEDDDIQEAPKNTEDSP